MSDDQIDSARSENLARSSERKNNPHIEIDEMHERWAIEILDKQYRLYTWNDGKMLALITINAILFAAIGFLFRGSLSDALVLTLTLFAATSISVSVILCLWHAIPRIRSGLAGDDPNPRSLFGITNHFKTWQSYYDGFLKLDRNTLFRHSVRQIYGMAKNNIRSWRLLNSAAMFTMVGVTAILLSMIAAAFSVRGIHPLGEWRPTAISGASSIPIPTTAQTPAKPPETQSQRKH